MEKLFLFFILALIILSGCSGTLDCIPVQNASYIIVDKKICYNHINFFSCVRGSYYYENPYKNITEIDVDFSTNKDTIIIYKKFTQLFQRSSWQYFNANNCYHNGNEIDSLVMIPYSNSKLRFKFNFNPTIQNDTVYVEFIIGTRLSSYNGLPLFMPNCEFFEINK